VSQIPFEWGKRARRGERDWQGEKGGGKHGGVCWG
jgi:hypothetical protein